MCKTEAKEKTRSSQRGGVEGHCGAQISSVNMLSTAEVSCADPMDKRPKTLDPGQRKRKVMSYVARVALLRTEREGVLNYG